MALRFARAGSAVTVVDTDPVRGGETAALLREAGSPVLFIRADVASSENIEGAVRATVAEFGDLTGIWNGMRSRQWSRSGGSSSAGQAG